mmetsp:Transcript_19196/g.48268  ORF Transcript_19196/g.48268 Transcript_19196/m.48268 type:complete len:204 (-) Transcript_19196:581-1192(-)
MHPELIPHVPASGHDTKVKAVPEVARLREIHVEEILLLCLVHVGELIQKVEPEKHANENLQNEADARGIHPLVQIDVDSLHLEVPRDAPTIPPIKRVGHIHERIDLRIVARHFELDHGRHLSDTPPFLQVRKHSACLRACRPAIKIELEPADISLTDVPLLLVSASSRVVFMRKEAVGCRARGIVRPVGDISVALALPVVPIR